MPRTAKSRRVCAEPKSHVFTPDHAEHAPLTLSMEELESLRLCDLEGMDQDMAAERMNVSRGTFQRILYAARRQVADALCHGKILRIGGGNYQVAQSRCQCPGMCAKCRFSEDDETKKEM